MLDKTRKIIYIITGTLTIISLVFMLMHKVGLCASSTPLDGSYSCPQDSSQWPFRIGSQYGYFSSDVINACIAYAFENKTMDSTHFIVFCREYGIGTNNDTNISIYSNYKVRYVQGSNWYDSYFQYYDGSGYQVYVDDSGNITGGSSRNASYNCYLYDISDNSPTGGRIIQTGQEYEGYILYSSDSEIVIDSSSSYGAGLVAWKIFSTGSGSNFEDGEVITLPNFDSLTGSPDSSDTQYSLFDKLKGWLSTLSGNIQKGFKNIEENLTSFFKPYFDNFKVFFDILENPEDFLFCSQERQQELLQGSQVYQDVHSLQGIGNNIFGVLGASASDHVYWTFDFSDTVLDNCGVVQIDFDWYDSIRSFVVPLFMAFFYVGMLLLIIRKIPGIISGASSNSDDK